MALDQWAKQVVNETLEEWQGVRFGKVSITIEGHYNNGQLNAIHIKPGGDAEHRPPKDGVAIK